MPLGAKICREKEKGCEDKISDLPDDLLVKILSEIPTKDAVTTMVLSKRWRFLWTMVYNLDYEDTDIDEKSIWDFLDKSLQLHKAPVLESLSIHLRKYCPFDVGKCVSLAVDRSVRELNLLLNFDETTLPKSLYTCKTLVILTLSKRILVDVPSTACLPSLQMLDLTCVEYEEEDSHVRLLSSCPVLKHLVLDRFNDDNVTRFSVKVPSLETLTYRRRITASFYSEYDMSLVIDSPGLKQFVFYDNSGTNSTFKNMPRLDAANLNFQLFEYSHPNDKFMTSFSSVLFLKLWSTDVAFCNGINFSRLIELDLWPKCSDNHWLELIMLLLHNYPKLRVLTINSGYNHIVSPLLWNQPSSVPGCLLSHLEYFEWEVFRGRREEKQFLAYILANSKCLETVEISSKSFDVPNENIQKMKDELESMYRATPSSQLLFYVDLIEI